MFKVKRFLSCKPNLFVDILTDRPTNGPTGWLIGKLHFQLFDIEYDLDQGHVALVWIHLRLHTKIRESNKEKLANLNTGLVETLT